MLSQHKFETRRTAAIRRHDQPTEAVRETGSSRRSIHVRRSFGASCIRPERVAADETSDAESDAAEMTVGPKVYLYRTLAGASVTACIPAGQCPSEATATATNSAPG